MILHRAGADARLYAIDKDARAIKTATELAKQDPRFAIYHGSFADIHQLAQQYDIAGKVDAILMDLGVSSPQLDDASRGFSFQNDGPLDMRMDVSQGISAAEWINSVEEQEMMQTFFDYGEEKYSRRIAKAIVERRQQRLFENTKDLADVIAKAHQIGRKANIPPLECFKPFELKLIKSWKIYRMRWSRLFRF